MNKLSFIAGFAGGAAFTLLWNLPFWLLFLLFWMGFGSVAIFLERNKVNFREHLFYCCFLCLLMGPFVLIFVYEEVLERLNLPKIEIRNPITFVKKGEND